MAPVIDDYFLPAYIEETLRESGRFQVTVSPLQNGLAVRHLEVDRGVLSIIGRALRRRRNELLGEVDLGDREGMAGRLAGIGGLMGEVGRPTSPLRREAMEILPHLSQFSPEMIGILLDSFADLEPEADGGGMGTLPPYQAAVVFAETPNGYARYYSGRLGLSLPRLLAVSRRFRSRPVFPLPLMGMPEVVSNIAAGNVPGISIMETLLALLVGAASLGKNATAEPYFGPRFLQELAARESQSGAFPLSDLAALVTFRGTEGPLLEEFIHQGDHLQATGGLGSKRAINSMVRRLRWRGLRGLTRRVSGHWHKVSFDVVAQKYLGSKYIDRVAFNVAFDNSMFNTQGCLSAQQVFVEGEEAEVLRFAERYIGHMRALLPALPKGDRPHEGLRRMYQRYEGQRGIQILTTLTDIQAYPFFVAYDGEPRRFEMYNGLNRSILIRRVSRLERDLPRLLGGGERRDLLQSCGVAVPRGRLLAVGEILGRAG